MPRPRSASLTAPRANRARSFADAPISVAAVATCSETVSTADSSSSASPSRARSARAIWSALRRIAVTDSLICSAESLNVPCNPVVRNRRWKRPSAAAAEAAPASRANASNRSSRPFTAPRVSTAISESPIGSSRASKSPAVIRRQVSAMVRRTASSGVSALLIGRGRSSATRPAGRSPSRARRGCPATPGHRPRPRPGCGSGGPRRRGSSRRAVSYTSEICIRDRPPAS